MPEADLPVIARSQLETQDWNPRIHLNTWKTREPTVLIPEPGSYEFRRNLGLACSARQDFFFLIPGTILKHEIGHLQDYYFFL